MSGHFADELTLRVRELGHPLCVGLDPHLAHIPPLFRRGSMRPADPETADVVEAFVSAVVERVAPGVAIVKPQIAFFEQLGWRGLRALERVVARALGAGCKVLLDAKRGDIGSTAEGYARAYLEPESPLAVDAITLNPYLGRDTLTPFAERARLHGRGLFILTKTSNPGSGDYQDRELADDDAPLFESVAASLCELSDALSGVETGWSSLGVVVGATYPGQAESVRANLPHALFLVPGYGAQGASAKDAVRGFVPGPAGLEGGIIASSRAILFPKDSDTNDATTWEKAIDRALESAINELANAITS